MLSGPLYLEAAAVLALLILGLAGLPGRVRASSSLVEWLQQTIVGLATPPWRAIALCGLLGFGVGPALHRGAAMPTEVADEFAYLLAGETFAAGRLTNPPHPLWPHFETMQVLQQPTYQSKYPPAQGLFLALGMRLGGAAVLGVWLSFGLACAATCWALQALLPPGWALVGGLLPVLRLGILRKGILFAYWSGSFWGGAVAMLGGALVLGGAARLRERVSPGPATLLALGLALLAHSRPWEGLLCSVPLLLWLVPRLGRRPPGELARAALPAVLLLAVAAAASMSYNRAVTGSALRMPHLAHELAYESFPHFFWIEPKPLPTIRHEVLRRNALRREADYVVLQSVRGFAGLAVHSLSHFWVFLIGPALTLPLVLALLRPQERGSAVAASACLLTAAGCLVAAVGRSSPHYLAPAVPPLYLLVVRGLVQLRSWRGSWAPAGRLLAAALPLVVAASFLRSLIDPPVPREAGRFGEQRAAMARALAALPAPALVIVRYAPDHVLDQEWVANDADIDRTHVAWAREMEADSDRRLIDYFRGRRAWLLEADRKPALLRPHPWASRPAATGPP